MVLVDCAGKIERREALVETSLEEHVAGLTEAAICVYGRPGVVEVSESGLAVMVTGKYLIQLANGVAVSEASN